MLGICYGMQLMVAQLGGQVRTPHHGGEYGRTIIRCGLDAIDGLVLTLNLILILMPT